ncbi:MAG: NAD(P)-dependent oxidoreductase [Patescibacteria group bacterium]|nr:NAD(P)-dependent oxidoreductase [Patescibacteria group bacterium]
MKKIAVIGTGIMGSGMVLNYLKHGYEVFVWNRSSDKLRTLLEKGAIEMPTPKTCAEKADIVFEVTADDRSSRNVWESPDGILAGAKSDTVLISSATLSLGWVLELARLCASKGFTYFDMPLTGGRSGAENGRLIFLVGGDEKKLESLTSDLSPVSEKVWYFGNAGSGTGAKLLLNMLQAIHLKGFGEAMRIAEKNAMDIEKIGAFLSERPGGTTTQFAFRDYLNPPKTPNFSLQWAFKDIAYAKQLADAEETPLLDTTLHVFKEAVAEGNGEKDWSCVIRPPQ